GRNLMLSVAVRPRLAAGDVWQLGAAAALGVRGGCAAFAALALKWPNDLVSLDGAKVAGLLIETTIEGDRISAAIFGVGINVNWPRLEMPSGIAVGATSLAEIAGVAIDRADLLADVLDALDAELVAIEAGLSPLPRYREACVTLGTTVGVETATGRIEGVAVEVDDVGALVIETTAGRVSLTSGEVVRLRAASPT
nr:biotin--[acetyl-CoA-carboxylase] ligase [Chloroflexota bacterium]